MNLNNNTGFTLTEILLYIAIFSVILTAATSFLMSISKSHSKAKIISEINSNSRFIFDIFSKEIRESKEIIKPSKSSTSSVLQLGLQGTTSTLEIKLDNEGSLVYNKSNKPSYILTSDLVKISSLTFKNTANSSTVDNVRVFMTIESINSSTPESYYKTKLRHSITRRKK